MEIKFTDSFFKSLKKMNFQNTWFVKFFYFFKYDLPNFFRNLWWFKKELWNFKSWDYVYNFKLLKRSLEKTLKAIESGNEIDSTRNKKAYQLKKTILLLNNFCEDNFIEQAEKELGKKVESDWFLSEKTDALKQIAEDEHNSPIFELARKKEEQQWNELWEIIKGKQHENIKYEELDGTDMRCWWT